MSSYQALVTLIVGAHTVPPYDLYYISSQWPQQSAGSGHEIQISTNIAAQMIAAKEKVIIHLLAIDR